MSITVLIALAVTLVSPDVYRGEMTVAVGTDDALVSAALGSEAQPITNTVSQLMRTNVVAATVIKRLKLEESSTEFLENLTIEQRPDAAVLDVAYNAKSKAQAVAVLDELSGVYEQQVKNVTGKPVGATAATGEEQQNVDIAVRVFDPPHALDAKVAPRPMRNIGVAFILGLMIAGFWIAVTDAARRRREEALESSPAGETPFGAGDRVEKVGAVKNGDAAPQTPKRRQAR